MVMCVEESFGVSEYYEIVFVLKFQLLTSGGETNQLFR